MRSFEDVLARIGRDAGSDESSESATFDQLLAQYGEGAFAETVGFGDRPALVVIDLINAFTDPESDLGSELDDVVTQTGRLLEAFRAHDLPRYFTTVGFEESFGDAGMFVRKVPALQELALGTDRVAVDERLEPVGDERVILKKYASAFFGTDLSSELVTNDVDTLVLAGVTTSGCVRATAVDSLQHGYRTIVPADAVGDRARLPHLANLFDIHAKYGDVVLTEDILEHLESTTPS